MDLDYLQALMGEAPAAEEVSYRGILVIGERQGPALARVTLELIGRAREMADGLGTRVSVALLGPGAETVGAEAIARGADTVLALPAGHLAVYRTAPYVRALTELIEARKPEIVLFGATAMGRDLAPRLAARLKTGLMADALTLEIDDAERLLLATAPEHGGALLATTACPVARPQIATVRPGALRVPAADKYREGEVEVVDSVADDVDLATEVDEVRPPAERPIDLGESRVLVAGGRGLGGPEGFALLEELAKSLDGQVAASRGAVEAGWIGKDRWVGVLGQHVSPDLYVACGIRGALQHRLGMKGSKCVVAINSDPEAPFFRFADFGLVGDYREIVPELIKELG